MWRSQLNSQFKWVPTKLQQSFMQPTEKDTKYDSHYLKVAQLCAELSRSKSPIGAVLVTSDYHILSTGYNGFPKQVNEFESKWVIAEPLYVVSAATNCIASAAKFGINIDNSICYCTEQPDPNDAGSLIQAGVSRFVFLTDNPPSWYNDDKHMLAISEELLATRQVRTYCHRI